VCVGVEEGRGGWAATGWVGGTRVGLQRRGQLLSGSVAPGGVKVKLKQCPQGCFKIFIYFYKKPFATSLRPWKPRLVVLVAVAWLSLWLPTEQPGQWWGWALRCPHM
jgi:hypothetical protein